MKRDPHARRRRCGIALSEVGRTRRGTMFELLMGRALILLLLMAPWAAAHLRQSEVKVTGFVRTAEFPPAPDEPSQSPTAVAWVPPPARSTVAGTLAETHTPEMPASAVQMGPRPAAVAPAEQEHTDEMVITGRPIVVDTATLAIGNRLVALFGVVGLSGDWAAGLQQFITANGDNVRCHAQDATRYVCLLPNGTDVAMAALINGAAFIGPDAPNPYLNQRNDAVRNHRGVWGAVVLPHIVVPANLPPELLSMYLPRIAENPLYSVEVVGDGGYLINSVPYAIIDGEFGAVAFDLSHGGWGFQDPIGHWHDAPHSLRVLLDLMHPHGDGLRLERR